MAGDQAAGLKRWSATRSSRGDARVYPETLFVLGHPDGSASEWCVRSLLEYWAHEGRAWVGNPASWQIIFVAASTPSLSLVARHARRWGLWVHKDRQGFRRAYHALRALAQAGGPRRVLAMHEPRMTTRGLLNNLRQAAKEYLDVELVVL